MQREVSQAVSVPSFFKVCADSHQLLYAVVLIGHSGDPPQHPDVASYAGMGCNFVIMVI